ncbi:hypothetical protein [Alkalicoccus halolimnae]|uniref:hypothetical protein n=1 Tax=Alkalicoccus halolimnae TaxID=1667239 RepID=UPI003BB104F0
MKRTIAITSLSLLTLSLAACGGNEADTGADASGNANENIEENTQNETNNQSEENGGNETNNQDEAENTGDGEGGTITYESPDGPVEVPEDPQRVAVLSTFAGNVMALDVPLVGVDAWSMDNPQFAEELEGVEEITDESLEKLIELDPDLIIGLDNINNVDQLNEIVLLSKKWTKHGHLFSAFVPVFPTLSTFPAFIQMES